MYRTANSQPAEDDGKVLEAGLISPGQYLRFGCVYRETCVFRFVENREPKTGSGRLLLKQEERNEREVKPSRIDEMVAQGRWHIQSQTSSVKVRK